MTLNPSHFEGEITIAQAGMHTPSEFALTSELKWFVLKYEPIFYKATIGSLLYQQMIEGMSAPDVSPVEDEDEGVDNNNTDEKSVLLFNSGYMKPDNYLLYDSFLKSIGDEPDINPKPNKWDYLAMRTAKHAAAFVWYYYMMNNNTQTSGSGEITPLMESGVKKSAQPKMVKDWNELVDSILPMTRWICERAEDYPDFNPDINLALHYGLTTYENLFAI